MHPPFLLSRDRDAWATIRGFVYQVALTLERWLDLADNEHLELEHGEDIDKVTKVLAATGLEESTRLLEQIKYRENSITLRSSSAIEFLAAATEHRHNNPGQTLRFRFLTTASVGTERPSPFTPRHPALEHWRSVVSQGEFDTSIVEKLLELVRSAGRPEGLAEDTWTLFQAFVSSASSATFFDFMKLIEWSFEGGDLNALAVAIRSKLIQRKHANTEEEAQDLYQRLFFHIFHLLSQRGPKAVTKASLVTQLARPPLPPQHQALFAQIAGQLSEIENRVTFVEQGLSTVQHGLSGVEQNLAIYRAEVQRIATSQGLPTTITLGQRTFAYTAPPINQGIVRRHALIKSLQADLASTSLLVLSGQSSIGKTQLARCIINPDQTLWLALRHKKMDEIVSLFETALSVAVAEHKSLIVLDDLPRLSSGMPLVEHLLHYADSDLRTVAKLMATTSTSLPLTLREDTPTGFFIERPVPLLTPDEIRDMLQVHRAPDRALTAHAAQLIHAVTTGHPVLVRALIRYLQKRDWSLSEDTIQAVVQRDFAKDVQKEAQQLLLQTVQGERSREFLHRLDLVMEPIRERQLQVVSDVEPSISAPFEQLDELRGIWLQEASSDSYLLSPLLEGMGVKNLKKEVQKSIHQELGNDIVSRRSLSIFEVDTAIHHFVAGKLHDRAGLLYLMATTSILGRPSQIRQLNLPMRWITTDLPAGMSLSIQLHVRGVQVRVLDALREDPMPALRRLDDLLNKDAAADELAIMHASLNAGPLRMNVSTTVVEKYYRRAIDASQKIVDTKEERTPEELRKVLYGMIWINSAHVKDLGDLREWLKTVREIGDAGRQQALNVTDSALRDEASFMLPQQLALEEYRKPAESRNWQSVIVAQEELEREAYDLGFVTLAGFAAAAQIVAIYEDSKDLDRIAKVARESLKRYGHIPIVDFSIRAMHGTQLGHANAYAEALIELKAALKIDTGTFARVHRLHAQIETARSASHASPEDAIELAQGAVQFAITHSVLGSLERAKARGELSIHLSDQRGVQAGYSSWAETVDEVLLAEEDTPQWKALFSIVGHSVGYYLSIATTGRPPEATADGDDYAKPLPGTFLRYSDRVDRFFVRGNKGLICAQLAMYAEAIGNDQEARQWAERGVQISEESGSDSTRALLVEQIFPFLLIANAFSAAIRGSVEAATTLLREFRRESSSIARQPADEQTLLSDGELMGRFRSLFPVFVRLAHMEQQGDPLVRVAAQEVIGTCNQLAHMSMQAEPWKLAASIFDAAFARAASKDEFSGFIKYADALQEQSLKTIALLGASLAPDVTMAQSFSNQITAVHYAIVGLRLKGSMLRLVIQPFVMDFWQKKFLTRKFSFRSPMRVEADLADASRLSGANSVRAILLAIRYGIGIDLPTGLAQWLEASLQEEGSQD